VNFYSMIAPKKAQAIARQGHMILQQHLQAEPDNWRTRLALAQLEEAMRRDDLLSATLRPVLQSLPESIGADGALMLALILRWRERTAGKEAALDVLRTCLHLADASVFIGLERTLAAGRSVAQCSNVDELAIPQNIRESLEYRQLIGAIEKRVAYLDSRY